VSLHITNSRHPERSLARSLRQTQSKDPDDSDLPRTLYFSSAIA
jgi:hypothetical protein